MVCENNKKTHGVNYYPELFAALQPEIDKGKLHPNVTTAAW
jgi:hypothetical protein